MKISKDEQIAHYKSLLEELEKHLTDIAHGKGIDPEANLAAQRVLSYHHRRQKQFETRAAEHGKA